MTTSPSEQLITQLDDYIEQLFNLPDPTLQAALRELEAAGMPSISITPNQGKLLYLLAKMCGARAILEIGTLAGYSTIWLGRALPVDGRLITLEVSPLHAEVAGRNLQRAGLSDRVTVRLGRALDELQRMSAAGEGPFDLVFIDADKPSYPAYLEAVLRLSRPGTIILADNVVRNGAVLDTNDRSEIVEGTRRFNTTLAAHPRLESTIFLHFKGAIDGMSLSRVR